MVSDVVYDITNKLKGDFMKDLDDYSGNIKLRLSKSLHQILSEQAEREGISLNQLCVMYLSASAASRNLGSQQFNSRLEEIAMESGTDDELLFQELKVLCDDVYALVPFLLKELKNIYEKKSRSIMEQLKALSYIYPVYYGDLTRTGFPYLKVPSAKIVVSQDREREICYKKIEEIASNVCPDISVAYGDFDLYIPLERRDISGIDTAMPVVITICCEFEDLYGYVQQMKQKLIDSGYVRAGQIKLKPCYLYKPARSLLEKAYPKAEFCLR